MPFSSTGKHLPNRMGFLFLQALEEAIGRDGKRTLLQTADPEGRWTSLSPDDLEKSFDFAYFAALCEATGTVYGKRTARRILFQSSRNSFRRAIPGLSALGGLDNPLLYSRPQEDRLGQSLFSMAKLLRLLTDIDIQYSPKPDRHILSVACCPECIGRSDSECLCYGMTGIIRGTLDWLGIDSEVAVLETHCIAYGADHCEFQVAASA